jgi:hypothetical protein
MSMMFLANVARTTSEKSVNFYTPYEHVVVDYPSKAQPNYMVWSYDHSDVAVAKDFAKAMDTAARWLKLAEPA